ncbi:hypothetical protein ScPMuIL_004099 [Solemya velum]
MMESADAEAVVSDHNETMKSNGQMPKSADLCTNEQDQKHVNRNIEMEVISESDRKDQDFDEKPKQCLKLRKCCLDFVQPLQTKHHPLPEKASICERFVFSLRCPPHGNLMMYIQFLVIFGFIWATLISLIGNEALPGGNIFSLLILFFTCVVGGYIVSIVRLPPLLGMLIIGAVLMNVPVIKVIGVGINKDWSGALRQVALTVILLRAGLGLDPKALRKLSCVVFRLAFSPCLMECVAEAVAAHYLLGFPWLWGIMLGFVLAAVSPAVVVPSLLGLSEHGYGLDKGIPTLVIAAASVDDVLAITGFGVVLGITFSTGDLALNIVKGPLEALLGVVFGIVAGVFVWFFPGKDSEHVVLFRSLLLLGGGLMATFGSSAVNLSGAGPLGCLSMAFVAAFRWRKQKGSHGVKPMEEIIAVLWMFFQPLLFGLIGAEVNISAVQADVVGLGIATLGIGLAVRVVVSFLAVFGSGLNFKEMLFIPFAWLPKATVQAAIGALALDKARKVNNEEWEILGKKLLTIAVLSILITAPLGAVAISLLGPRLLKRDAVPNIAESKATTEDSDKQNSVVFDNPCIIDDEKHISEMTAL